MTVETPQNEMEQQKPEQVEATPATQEAQPAPEKAEQQDESALDSAKNAIQSQAQRYAYIEKLEGLLDTNPNGEASFADFTNVLHCKTQVLLELVSVAGYVSTLPADSPQHKAADVLMSHLYKCYDKTEKLREKMLSHHQYMRNRRQRDAWFFSLENQEELRRPYVENNPLAGAFGAYMGGIAKDLPGSKRINLVDIARSTGSTAILNDLIRHPSELIKAQMPDLISELYAKATDTDKETANKYIHGLLENLTALKKPKSMNDALEGINAFSNLLAMGSSMAKGI